MPANSGGRRERRKEETRAQIFQAAMRLFEKKGIIETTVEEITDAADVGKGTFFNYFPAKEAILAKLAETQLGVLSRAVEQSKTAPSMQPVLRELAKNISKNPGRSQMMLRSLLGLALNNKTLFELFSTVLSKGRERVAEIVERGQDLGEIRKDLPASVIARCMQQTIFGTNFIWAAMPPSDLMSWQERSFDIFWRGIAAGPEKAATASKKESGTRK